MLSLKQKHLDLAQRSHEREWLDGANIDPVELEWVLRDLARLNRASLGHQPVLNWLQRAAGAEPGQHPMTLVDVGCGYGDLLRAVRRWSRRRGLVINLHGIDLNPETIRIARTATDDDDRIDFEVADIFAFRPVAPIDLVVSSLVTHHFSDVMIVEFLRWMEATARRGWLIYDLQRHRLLHRAIAVIGRIARLHPMVIRDGQISVARSLTQPEWEERLAAAGIARDLVEIRRFVFRFAIGRLR